MAIDVNAQNVVDDLDDLIQGGVSNSEDEYEEDEDIFGFDEDAYDEEEDGEEDGEEDEEADFGLEDEDFEGDETAFNNDEEVSAADDLDLDNLEVGVHENPSGGAHDNSSGDFPDKSGDVQITYDETVIGRKGKNLPSAEEVEAFENRDKVPNNLGISDIDRILTGVKYERHLEEIPLESLAISEQTKALRQRTLIGLTASIADMGRVLNPVDVIALPNPTDDDDDQMYMLISGMRRFFGALKNQMKTIPAFVWRFEDTEKATKLGYLLGLVINKQQFPDMSEIWSAMQVLERDYNLKPDQIERLFPTLQSGDAMKLKDVALASYDEPRDLLFSGENTLDKSYKLLQKLRKEEDTLELEDNKGILSDVEGSEEVMDIEGSSGENLTNDEVKAILEMEDEVDLSDDSLFNENADSGHVQDRRGDGDDDLSTDAKNKIKLRDKFLCRVCCSVGGKEDPEWKTIDPALAEDASAFLSTLTVHHVIPVHAGGTDDDNNLVTLCLLCHHRLHVMEKIGGISVSKEEFNALSPKRQHDILGAYYFARKAIKAGQVKGYTRKQRAELAQQSLKHKFPGQDIKNDTALLRKIEHK